ncbi:NRT1 PTR FAMILY -like [Olea europaea subsp. europaea]|uniref:NRT1 PTR FAMILY -like n=1 Tax=Olea europaea subsp. europaea TaxID=158383 RepID=A0A8S0QP31_OLEEU|nr:NRT1 PTR FAMILY -like [Olea europaea subsp. europaea]
MRIINWCLNKLFYYDGFHLMDEIYGYGLILVFAVVMKVLGHILVTFLRVVWEIPVMSIIKWCSLKKAFYYLRSSIEVPIFISVITSYISFAENALEGTSTYLQILFAITLDNYPGRFKLVVYSTISYIFVSRSTSIATLSGNRPEFKYRDSRFLPDAAANNCVNSTKGSILESVSGGKGHSNRRREERKTTKPWSDKDPIAIEEENRPGNTCTVAQVKEVKFFFGMVPMWTTFHIFSLVEATGSTFFLKQASNIDDKFPVTVFLILVTVTSFAIDYLCDFLFRKIGNEMNGQLIMQWRIGVGMAFSFISCIFAYKNAVHWLDLVKIYKQPSMHMDIFCLTPQFLLLGIMKGLSERGLQSFFRSLLSESLRDYRTPFGECVMGIGKFLSTLCILRFKSWFGHDMDSSCLDNFYAILTILSFVNLLVFWVALVNYYGDDQFSPQAVDSEQPIEGTQDSFGPSVLLSFSDQTPHNLKYISVSKRRTQSLPDMMPNNPPYISVSPRITRSFSVSACPITPKLDDAHTQEIEQQH